MKYFVNPNIKNTFRVFPKQGRIEFHRYDANENPEGLPKEFVDSVLSEITPEYLAMYPEPERFISKYAEFIGVGDKNVYATNGSDHGIRVLLETFGEPGKEVVTVSPTFEIYWVCCSLLGLKHKPVTYDSDFTIPIDKILDAITNDTRVVVLLNPNSPIGNLYNEDSTVAIKLNGNIHTKSIYYILLIINMIKLVSVKNFKSRTSLSFQIEKSKYSHKNL